MPDLTHKQAARLKELEVKTGRTPEEEAVRVALLELDEKLEDLTEAQKANPVPDPVAVAQDAVNVAQKAYDDAEAAVPPVV